MKAILTNEEVAKAIYVEPDYDAATLESYALMASSFIKEKTGHNFAEDAEIEPLAKQCAILYIRQMHFGADGYNKDYDYTLGIVSLLKTLEDMKK